MWTYIFHVALLSYALILDKKKEPYFYDSFMFIVRKLYDYSTRSIFDFTAFANLDTLDSDTFILMAIS